MSAPQTLTSTTESATAPEQHASSQESSNPKSSSTSNPKPSNSQSSKHKTSIQFDISNKTSLSDLSKRFNPANPPPEAPTPKMKSTYFEKLDMAVRLELDHGTQHIIDVQPDLRFPFQYMIYNITEQFPDLTVKSHPFVSTFTLIAYQQIVFNAYILICDLYSREIVSYRAASFKNDPSKMDYLTKLLDCYIPADLEPLLNAFAPTFDPQRRLQLFVPSFAGFDFALDFGRIVPPSMMILAHHLLASVRTNSDPEVILRTFYSTPIISILDESYTPANFLGGYFDRNQRPTSHSNWLNSRFEKIFNPVIGRALLQRPTLAKTRIQPFSYPDIDNVDPYEFLLCYSDDNIEKIFEILTDVSSFLHTESSAPRKLGQILENSSGITIMYHSLWSATLPTCHSLSPPTVTSPLETDSLTDAAYSKYVKFMSPAPTFKSKLNPPSSDIDANFYLVSKDPFDLLNPPFKYESFDRHRHITPDVLWFQPYSKNPSALNYALTLGLLIESGDLDGVTIPLPNIDMSLTENNSMYLQGTLPLVKILKFNPNSTETDRFRLCTRATHSDENQPIGIAFRDCSTVLVPRFGNEHVRSNMHRIYGATIHENCNDNEINFTFTASTYPEAPPIPDFSVHLWSSYRYVAKSNMKRKLVYLYFTLRQFYGENVTLSRTRNPILLLPS